MNDASLEEKPSAALRLKVILDHFGAYKGFVMSGLCVFAGIFSVVILAPWPKLLTRAFCKVTFRLFISGTVMVVFALLAMFAGDVISYSAKAAMG